MEREIEELEKIEEKYWRTYLQSVRRQQIWDAIAIEVNSNHPKEEAAFWGRVMDLFHTKY